MQSSKIRGKAVTIHLRRFFRFVCLATGFVSHYWIFGHDPKIVISNTSSNLSKKKEGRATIQHAFRICILSQLVPIIREYWIESQGIGTNGFLSWRQKRSQSSADVFRITHQVPQIVWGWTGMSKRSAGLHFIPFIELSADGQACILNTLLCIFNSEIPWRVWYGEINVGDDCSNLWFVSWESNCAYAQNEFTRSEGKCWDVIRKPNLCNSPNILIAQIMENCSTGGPIKTIAYFRSYRRLPASNFW